MIQQGETTPLLLGSKPSPTRDCCGPTFRFFCTMAIIVLCFKGGGEMASAMRQYIYIWCEDYVNKTFDPVPGNNTPEASRPSTHSDSCGLNTSSLEHEAQVLASNWELYISIFHAVLLFFSLSVFGTLSDYLGRKPFVCLSILGYTLKTASLAIIIKYKLHLAFMFISFAIDGVCGSNFIFSLFSYTMTADITRGAKNRVLGITIMETLISMGRCSTQFGTGYFIQKIGFFYPMLAATIACFMSLVFAIVLLPETNPRLSNNDVQIQFNRVRAIPKLSILARNYVSFYVGQEQYKKVFWVCFVAFFLLEFGILGRADALILYQLGSPFCWSSETIGLYTGLQMAVCFVLGSLMLKPLQLCLPDHAIVCIGIGSAIAFNVVTAFARSTSSLFVAIAVGLLMILPKSILRGMMSSRATGDKQGAMFASLSSSELVCKLIASPASLSIYSHTLNTFKGGVFLALGGVDLVALILMICSVKLFNTRSTHPAECDPNTTCKQIQCGSDNDSHTDTHPDSPPHISKNMTCLVKNC